MTDRSQRTPGGAWTCLKVRKLLSCHKPSAAIGSRQFFPTGKRGWGGAPTSTLAGQGSGAGLGGRPARHSSGNLSPRGWCQYHGWDRSPRCLCTGGRSPSPACASTVADGGGFALHAGQVLGVMGPHGAARPAWSGFAAAPLRARAGRVGRAVTLENIRRPKAGRLNLCGVAENHRQRCNLANRLRFLSLNVSIISTASGLVHQLHCKYVEIE